MTDVQKLKETTCKEIHSLLMSGNQALTKRQVENDYKAFIGTLIPFRQMGYINLESFLRDNPQFFKLYWDGPMLMIKHVSNSETEHIEAMISKQKPKKKRPPHSRSRYFTGGSRFPKPRYAPILTPAAPSVPNILRGEIRGLLMEYQNGILGSNFDVAYAKRYGNYVNYKAMKFHTMLEVFKAMPDIVSIEQEPSGIYKIFPRNRKNVAGIERQPSRDHHRLNSSLAPRFQRLRSGENTNTSRNTTGTSKASDTKSHTSSKGENWDVTDESDSFEGNVYDNSGVNSNMQREIQMLLSKHREGVWASRFQAAYRVEFKKEFDMRSQGYNSVITLMSDLPHIVTIERANQRDWLLYDARYRKQSSRDIHTGVINALANNSTEASSRGRYNTAPPPAPPPVDEDLKEAVRQVIAYHPQGVILDELPMVFKQLTGEELDPAKSGYKDLTQLLLAVDDVIHMEYLKDSKKMLLYPQVRESVPRRDKLKNIRKKPSEPLTMPTRQKREREIPQDVVAPESSYRQQGVSQKSLADNANYVEVFVATVINPGYFWLQIKGIDTTDTLNTLMDRLEDVYCNTSTAQEYALPEELMIKGQVCAAVYPPEGDYHRCRITGFREPDFAELFYVDYGSTYIVTKKSLKFLKLQDFELPAQSIQAKLSNITPIGKDWTREARDLMLQLVNNRPLVALVTDIALDGSMSVCLTDTNGDVDLHINDVLVNKGLAEMDFNPTESYLPPPIPNIPQPVEHPVEHPVPEDNVPSQPEPSEEPRSPSSGNTEDSDCRRHIRFVQLTPENKFHLICYNNEPYVTSGEISCLLWPGKDMLRSMMRQKRMNVKKVVVPRDENPEIFDEFIRYEVGGTSDSSGEQKSHVTVFELASVLTILNMFDHPSNELISAIRQLANNFNPNDPYWKGGESEEDEEEESEDEECFVVGRQTLESTLQLLQFKRKRILQAMQNMDSDNTITLVEDLEVVEKQLQDFKQRLKELDRLERNEEPESKGKPNTKKLTEEEEFVCDMVSAQSESYLEANADLKADTKPSEPSPKVGVLSATPRAGVQTNMVAPMMAESKPESPSCTDIDTSQSTTNPTQAPLGHSLMNPAMYSMGLGALPGTNLAQNSTTLMPTLPPNQYLQLLQYQSMLMASGGLQTGVNPMMAMSGLGTPMPGLNASTQQMPGVASPIAGLGTPMPGVATQMHGVATQMPGVATQMPGLAPPMPGLGSSIGMSVNSSAMPFGSMNPGQGRGRGMSVIRPPPGGFQKKQL